jgi:hypothetical protein
MACGWQQKQESGRDCSKPVSVAHCSRCVCGKGTGPLGSRREPHKLAPSRRARSMRATHVRLRLILLLLRCLCAVHLLVSPTSSVAQIHLFPLLSLSCGCNGTPAIGLRNTHTCLHNCTLAPCRLHHPSHSRHDTPRIRPQQRTTAQRRLQLPHRHPRRPQQQQPQLAQLHRMRLQHPRAVMLLPLRCTL